MVHRSPPFFQLAQRTFSRCSIFFFRKVQPALMTQAQEERMKRGSTRRRGCGHMACMLAGCGEFTTESVPPVRSASGGQRVPSPRPGRQNERREGKRAVGWWALSPHAHVARRTSHAVHSKQHAPTAHPSHIEPTLNQQPTPTKPNQTPTLTSSQMEEREARYTIR